MANATSDNQSDSKITTMAQLTRVHARERGDKVAIISNERSVTYAELDAESCRVANALAAAGVGSGDRVGFVAKNVIEYFTLTFGAAKLNAVTVAVNWRLAPPEMEYILTHAEVKVVAFDPEFLEHYDKMSLDLDPTLIVVGEASAGRLSYDDWIDGHSADDPGTDSTPDDTALQLYTSGTTGLPKGAELSNRNLFSIVDPLSGIMNLDENGVLLHVLPLFHIGGSGVAIVGLYQGCTNILHRDVDPVKIITDIGAHRVSHSFMVPALLQVLPMMPGASDADYSSLKTILYGASPITEEVLVASMALLKSPHCQVYGLTETTGAITLLLPEDHDPGGPKANLLRSAGQPVPGVSLRIVDEDGKALPDGEIGEIWCHSVQNLKAYWRNPEATSGAFPEGRDAEGLGWFATGDAGYLEDGYLFIRDRVKDMIVSGGENVYPAEVENALMSHPDIADCAVIGVPSDRWGETVKAIIIPAEGTDPSDEDLIAHCQERLAKFKCPTSVDRIEVIPRNPSGKVLKTELRKPYWAGRDRAVN